jgi:anti-anti-sigma factor
MAGPGPGTTEVISLSGHLDGRCTTSLRELIAAHLARHADEDLRLDMSEVESVDLTVLRLLAAVAVRLQRDGHRLVLLGCRPSLRRVLTHGVLPRLFVVQRTAPEV